MEMMSSVAFPNVAERRPAKESGRYSDKLSVTSPNKAARGMRDKKAKKKVAPGLSLPEPTPMPIGTARSSYTRKFKKESRK